MKIYICKVCGHLEFNALPDNCPTCLALAEEFRQNDSVFEEAREKSPKAQEKHIPHLKIDKSCDLIQEGTCTDILIQIGEALHPMKDNHFIQFIDIYRDYNYIERIMLSPEVQPCSSVHVQESSGRITVVQLCNLHGYWVAGLDL